MYRYTECPDFQILMAAWAHDDEPVQVAIGEAAVRLIPGLWDPTVQKCAHNAQFERVCFSRMAGGWLDPYEWHDTQALAAEYGRPLNLAHLARSLGAEPKDEAGKALIRLFTRPNRKGGWNDTTTHPLEWLDFISYCAQDVSTLRDVARRLGPWPNDMERQIWIADQEINDNGLPIDVPMAYLAEAASLENIERMKEKTAGEIDNARSVQQVRAWLNRRGHPLPDLQAETVGAALEGDLPDDVREVLELRQELALAASSKYSAALATVSPDGRIRGSFRFYGAHTGRWSGKGAQPQNLPRAAFKTEAEEQDAINRLFAGQGGSQLDLKKLVRSVFKGPFTVVDYASIEARVVAWLAGEQWALDAFAAGRDIYVETAERMGGLTRSQGKVAVLALGYNGGVNSLRNMGAEGDDEELQRMVTIWRKANPRIVRLWATMQDGIEDGGRVGRHLLLTRKGNSMRMHLPSGRSLNYHHVKWERHKQPGREARESWCYKDPGSRFNCTPTYGGRLVENATQAVARDILGEALVRLHEHGYTVAGHVHDEIIVEGEHDVEVIKKIMCEVPDWATGLPIDGEGFTCDRYRKG